MNGFVESQFYFLKPENRDRFWGQERSFSLVFGD